MTEESTTGNSRMAKKRFQRLNEALCFVTSSALADSFRFQKPTNAKPEIVMHEGKKNDA